MIYRANAKINLGLDVLRRRADGYHDIETVMLPVPELYDELDIRPASQNRFEMRGLLLDCPDEDNLCLRATRMMQERYGVGAVSIVLDKRIPFGAGLGGGSSDATTVILAMNELFELGLPQAELEACAATLGSDTAFFVRNTPQLCTGRGEVMTPVEVDLTAYRVEIVKPDVNVSTRDAYAGVVPCVPEVPLLQRLRRPIETWQKTIVNAFEAPVFKMHPSVARAKQDLINRGAIYAAMSGSGSAVFGLYPALH